MCVGVQGGGGSEGGCVCVWMCVEVKIEGEEPFCWVCYAL